MVLAKSCSLKILAIGSNCTYQVVNLNLDGQHVHYQFAQNSKSALARRGLVALATSVLSKGHLSECSWYHWKALLMLYPLTP